MNKSLRIGAIMLLVMALASTGVVAGIDAPIPETDMEKDPLTVFPEDVEPSRVMILFNDVVPNPVPAYVNDLGGKIVMSEPYLPMIVVSIEPVKSGELIDRAEADERVLSAEHDRYVYPTYTPNDMLGSWGQSAIGLHDAWDITLGSHDVDLHILDTGIDHAHLDLLDNLSPMCDEPTALGHSTIGTGVVGQFQGLPMGQDSGFHGTHVAGIAGAVINNTIGVSGASQSCMTSVQVLAAESGLMSWVITGIMWSATNGADIISMSLGASSGSSALEWAVGQAYSTHGALLVSSAGNDDCGPVGYPAAYDEVVAVGALRSLSFRADYSSCGPEVEVSAPGSGIWSTLPGNTYGPLSGTSMAAPLVSGVAGLVWAENPALTNTQVRCILSATTDDLGSSGHNNQYGWGRINAFDAVLAAQDPSLIDTSRGVC